MSGDVALHHAATADCVVLDVRAGAGAGACVVTTIAYGYEHFRGLTGIAVYSDQSGKHHLVTADYDDNYLCSVDLQTGSTASHGSDCQWMSSDLCLLVQELQANSLVQECTVTPTLALRSVDFRIRIVYALIQALVAV